MVYSSANIQFTEMLKAILHSNRRIEGRNGGVTRLEGMLAQFNSTPLISIRRTAWKNALLEWEWFMSGSSDINDLDPKVHSWWSPWAKEGGLIPNNYGAQLRHAEGPYEEPFDQIKYIQDTLMTKPHSRRMVITTWNPQAMAHKETPITNCHNTATQFFVYDNKLSIITYQRSSDMVLGLPHNWIQMWAFLLFMAKGAGLEVGELKWFGGDCHIYDDHKEAAEQMINYLSKNEDLPVPELIYSGDGKVFRASDFSLSGEYQPIFKTKLNMSI